MADAFQMTLDVTQLDQFVKRFGQQVIPITKYTTRRALDEALEFLLNLVVDNVPVNYGVLRGSVYSEVRGVSADALRGVEVEGFVSSSDYEPKVIAMERGRAKGNMPPIEAIALWVKRKGLETDEKEIMRAAYLIARAIAERRSKHQREPFAMFETAADKGAKQVDKIFDEALDELLKRWSSI